MNAILTIALLTLFVVLHELGHYISRQQLKALFPIGELGLRL